jgi:hypothetical protein
MDLVLWVIRVIHYLTVLFFVLAPFTNNQQLLTMHFVLVPFLMLHWVTNQSVCALTEMEKFLTNKTEDHETFIGKIVGPIYKFQTPGQENAFVWIILTLLWLISLYKLRETKFELIREVFSHLRETLRR